jgi:thiol-disulfide isomerase/thioredoxin
MRRILCSFALILIAAPVVRAQAEPPKVLEPKKAYLELQAQLQAARQAREFQLYRELKETMPKAFLEAFENAGKPAEGEDLFYLGLWYVMAERRPEALEAYRECAKNMDIMLLRSRLSYASTAAQAASLEKLSEEEMQAAITQTEAYLTAYTRDDDRITRANLHNALGPLYDQTGDTDRAIDHWMDAARNQPRYAYGSGRSLTGALMKQMVDLEKAAATKARTRLYVDELMALAQRNVDAAKATEDQRAIQNAERLTTRIPRLMQPYDLIGQPAPDWTLLKAYGKRKQLSDYRGEVVLLDFWATWCPWCIKSFPALRDLIKDYRREGLRIVGVTAPANAVYDARYDLDDDLKEKARDFKPTSIRLDRDASPEESSDFRRKEKADLHREPQHDLGRGPDRCERAVAEVRAHGLAPRGGHRPEGKNPLLQVGRAAARSAARGEEGAGDPGEDPGGVVHDPAPISVE